MRRLLFILLLSSFLVGESASALMLERNLRGVPVARLLRNSQRALRPNSGAADHAIVARLHTMAAVSAQKDATLGTPRQHLIDAVREYERAVTQEPLAVYQHGLGYALELAAREKITELGSAMELRQRAAAMYEQALLRAPFEPSALRPFPSFVEKLRVETEEALTRLAQDAVADGESRKPAKKQKKEKPKKDEKADQKKEKHDPCKKADGSDDPRCSPIVFGPADSVADLVQSEHPTHFDIAGDGQARTWPWVKADTGILVWDPTRSSRIQSGRQLFGSVTFWIFWPDGYRALAALDDDGDGWLSGAELLGIAVWRDKNQDGISTADEVVPVEKAGVLRIAVQPRRAKDGVLRHEKGVLLRDGAQPSFDWFPSAIRREICVAGARP